MATKTFYWLPDASAGTSAHGSLQDGGSAPVASDANSQFKVGTDASGNYAKYFRNTQRQPADFNSTVQPDGNIDNIHGDCLRSQNAYTGYFAAGNWTISFGLRPSNTHVGTTAALRARIFRSKDPGGANATELTASPLATSSFDGSNTTAQSINVTWNPGAFSLQGEYLFFELALDITGAGNTLNYTWILQTGPNISQILTTDFSDDPSTYLDQRQHLSKKKRCRKKRGPKKRSRWVPPNGVVVAQPFPFANRKKKWPKRKPPKKKRRDRLEYIAITIATSPPGFPFRPRKKVPRKWPRSRKRLKQWQNFPSPYKQFAPALCGHLFVLSALAATASILESLSAKSDTRVLEALDNFIKANPIRIFESLSGKAKEFEGLSATATLICCK
jgi:hypothetical protein